MGQPRIRLVLDSGGKSVHEARRRADVSDRSGVVRAVAACLAIGLATAVSVAQASEEGVVACGTASVDMRDTRGNRLSNDLHWNSEIDFAILAAPEAPRLLSGSFGPDLTAPLAPGVHEYPLDSGPGQVVARVIEEIASAASLPMRYVSLTAKRSLSDFVEPITAPLLPSLTVQIKERDRPVAVFADVIFGWLPSGTHWENAQGRRRLVLDALTCDVHFIARFEGFGYHNDARPGDPLYMSHSAVNVTLTSGFDAPEVQPALRSCLALALGIEPVPPRQDLRPYADELRCIGDAHKKIMSK